MFGLKKIKRNSMDKELDEAAQKWVFETNGHKWSNNDDTAGDNYGSFKEGAKWQAERMYSEEDLRRAYTVGKHGGVNQTYYDFDEWFEQFKKK